MSIVTIQHIWHNSAADFLLVRSEPFLEFEPFLRTLTIAVSAIWRHVENICKVAHLRSQT